MRATRRPITCIATVLIAAVALLFPLVSAAQNNRFKIDDRAFEIYEEADRKRYTDEGMRLGSQLYDYAVRIGDKKAQCLALSIPLHYYNKKGEIGKLKDAVERMKALAKRHGITQYYYFAWGKWIEYNLTNGHTLVALQETMTMQNEAFNSNPPDHYGIGSSYKMLANIYWMRKDYDHAIQYYQETLNYYLTYLPEQDPTTIYNMLARCFRQRGEYEKSLRMVEEGLKNGKLKHPMQRLKIQRALTLYEMGRYNDFLKECESYRKTSPVIGRGEQYIDMQIYECVVKKDYDKARSLLTEMPDSVDRKYAEILIYTDKGDWKRMAKLWEEYFDDYAKSISNIQSQDIADVNAALGSTRKEMERLQLELQLANSVSERARMEREKLLVSARMHEMEQAKNALTLSNALRSDSLSKAKNLIKDQLMAAQQADWEQEQETHKLYLSISVLVVMILLIFLGNAWLNRMKSRKFIAKLTQSNIELDHARQKAEESNRLKSQFVQNVSHEIRTPLNAIVGFTDLMNNPEVEVSQEEKQEFLKIIHTNTDLLTNLVNDVLALSELQSGKAQANYSECAVNGICRTALTTVEHRKPEGVDLHFTTDVDDTFTVTSDPRRISQVLINFLTNAEKYTAEGSITLDCSAKKNDGYVTFTVTDTGCGIPKEKQQQIFDRFEKLDDFHQGMGLGLNICSLIADMLDAKIGIDSEYTDGARFYFCVKNEPSNNR